MCNCTFYTYWNILPNSGQKFFRKVFFLLIPVMSGFTNWAKIPLKDEEIFILLNRRKSKKKTISNGMSDSQRYT